MKVSEELRKECENIDNNIKENEKYLQNLEERTEERQKELAKNTTYKAKLLEAISFLEEAGK